MNVNNIAELSSISNKLEYKETKDSIKNTTQKIFSSQAYSVDSGNNKNQLFQMGDVSQDDIKDALAGEPSEFVRGAMTALGNTMTETDLSKLDEEGYDLEDSKVETVVTVTDKIQIYLATHCEDYQVTSDISMDEIQKVTGNSGMAYDVARKLQESNLPVTKDNLEESMEAMELASQLKPITDGSAKYMINNGLTPTIENIYKAEYSGQSVSGGTYGVGYFTEGTGYYGKTSDEFNWDSLKEQMSKVIQNADLEVNDDTLSGAKWLIENHIPLTEESIKEFENLKNITLPADSEEVLDGIIQAIQAGKRPAQALLSQQSSFIERAQEACEIVENTTDENLKTVIASEQPITLYNLKKAQESATNNSASTTEATNDTNSSATSSAATSTTVNANTTTTSDATTNVFTSGASTIATVSGTTNSTGIQVTEDNIALITARRQLEEIRLQMTVEANYKLLKQGISIETQELSTLIDQLKNAEDSYYKRLLSNDNLEGTEVNISSFKEITTKVSEIKFVPSTVLASVVSGETSNTINGIHSTGTALKSAYDAAGESYEALMTKPRSDMGDNIKKAFQNVDDILNDLQLDTTKSNRRAVRILGYNSMEITQENINAVKAADAAVSNTISNLTPKVVLNMIREGINPLDMNINELNNQISEMQSTIGDDNTQEKYSEYLWKLEKSDSITSQERDAYIGMYRLINNVEKTDGEVIGALVNQNADITLKNLLTGVRNIKNKGMDVAVDDNFGELESLTFQSTSISDQLAAGFQGSSTDSSQDQSNNQNSEATTYYNNLIDKVLRELSPEKLSQIFESGNIKDMSLEQFADQLASAKEDNTLSQEYYKEQLSVLKEASQVEASVIKMLSDYGQPVTINNILAVESLTSKRGSMFKQLLSKEEEDSEVNQAADNIAKEITSKEDLEQAYEELENTALSALDKKAEQTDVTSIDLKQLKMLRNEIRLATSLSKEEKYEIPVRIGDEITSINLTVVHSEDTSKVSISMENETIGKATAEFTLKDQTVSGYIVTDNQNGLEILKENQEEFEAQLQDSGLTSSKVDYMASKSLNMNKFGKEPESETIASTNETSTRDLYSVARAFVVAMQKAGSN